jgi:hypothetical protein
VEISFLKLLVEPDSNPVSGFASRLTRREL